MKVVKIIRNILIGVCLLYIAAIVIFNLIGFKVINGQSMQPTYYGNKEEIAITEKKADIVSGDVVIVKLNLFKHICKRVIACPGDQVEIENGYIYINGTKTEYQKEIIDVENKYITQNMESITLKENEYFCVGDNINNSVDSRYYGPFMYDKIRKVKKTIKLPIKVPLI